MFSTIAFFIAAHAPPAEQIYQLVAVSHQTKEWLSDNLGANIEWLEFKPWTVYGCIEKDGKYQFMKLHEAGKAFEELERGRAFNRYLPTIIGEEVISLPPFECLIQPYLKSIDQPGGMFFDSFYLFPDRVLPLLDQMVQLVKQVVFKTLDIRVAPALNDRLYFDRLKRKDLEGVSGRLETYYSGKKILNLPWEDLLERKFLIDDVPYDLTLRDLLKKAKEVLDPSRLRPLAVCHGDWHDMNICVIEGAPYFLDCDLAGKNDPIGDAAVFLIYDVVQGDYLGPKYFKSHFPFREKALKAVQLERLPIQWNCLENEIIIKGGHRFGVSDCRLEAARYFIDHYFNPLIEEICNLGFNAEEIEEKVRAVLLMRFLAVYNLTELDPEDQVRVLALLVQTLCQKDEPVLSVFWRYL